MKKGKCLFSSIALCAAIAINSICAVAADNINSPVKPNTPPKAVTKLIVTSKKPRIANITFVESTTKNVSGYQIRIYNKNGRLVDTIYSKDGKGKTKGRKSGAKYTVKVRAYKLVNGKRIYSSYETKDIVIK